MKQSKTRSLLSKLLKSRILNIGFFKNPFTHLKTVSHRSDVWNIRTLVFTILIASSTIIPTPKAEAAEKIRFGTFPIPFLVIDQENGVFIEITREILKRTGIEAEIIIQPPKRTLLNFKNNKIDVLFPALDVFFSENDNIIRTESFDVKRDFAFTKKEAEMVTDLSELKGQTIGITRGYPYATEIIENKDLTFEYANSDEQNAKKLILGRVDAFIVEERTGLQAFKNTSLEDKIHYDETNPLSVNYSFYSLQQNSANNELAEKINQALKDMKEDGTFDRLWNYKNPFDK